MLVNSTRYRGLAAIELLDHIFQSERLFFPSPDRRQSLVSFLNIGDVFQTIEKSVDFVSER